MMEQMTLATVKGFEVHGRATRKAEFLARMERRVPWAEMCGLIEPHYPKAGNGRPPVGLFPITELGIAGELARCLVTTNVIESPNSVVRRVSRRVTNYKSADMALR
jgi:hypothetical protein